MLGNNRSVGVSGWNTGDYYQGGAAEMPGDAAFSASVAFAMPNPGAGVSTLFANLQPLGAVGVAERGWFIGVSGANTGAILYAGVGDDSGTAGGGVRLTSPLAVDAGPQLRGFNVVTLTADATDARLYWNGSAVDLNTIGAAVLASTLNPTVGVADSGTPQNPAINATIFGCAYADEVFTNIQIFNHWLACSKAGRMVDAVHGGGALAAGVPTFDNLYDAFANNRGDTGNLIASANPAVGNQPAAAATWADQKAAINLTQAAADLYTVGHRYR